MKKRIPIILLTSIIIFAKENNITPQISFPLDARQITLPPLDIFQTRDFTELLGISTTAPVSDGTMYFHADIPDSILDAGPVEAFIFYGNGQNSDWSEEDAYYLGTPGYENTFEAVAQTPSSGDLHIGVQANLTFEGIEVTATQSPYNASDNVPAPWYLNACEDETGDEETGNQSLDIQDISVAVSDNRIHVHLTNAGGGFPTGGFWGPWNLYVVGFLNPEDPDSSLYGIAYGDGGFGLLYPGVWKFQLDADLPVFVGDIDYTITGNNLYMAANMSDIFNDSDFGEWPNEFEAVVVTGLTVSASFDEMIIGDATDPAFMNPGFQSYEIGQNTAPFLSELTYEVVGDTSGLSLVSLQTAYTDEDNHFPINSEFSIYQDWDLLYSGNLISYDHSYSDGSNFEIILPLDSGTYEVVTFFNDGMDSVENSTTINIGGGNFDYDVSIISGWNLVGLSVNMELPGQLSVFPSSVDETLYGYSDSYFLTDALVPGFGYWLRFDEGDSVTVSGNVINEVAISLTEGWNLIAGPSEDVSIGSAYDPESLIVPNTMFGYNTTGYTETDVLSPGYGYWIRSFGEGEVSLSIAWSGGHSTSSLLDKRKLDMNSITINGKKLFFGSSSISSKDRLSYSLPPKPPATAKDIRFSNSSRLCLTDECTVELTNYNEPIYVECNVIDGETWEVIDDKGEIFSCSNLPVSGVSCNLEYLTLRKSNNFTPETFSVSPAFPNPFNPVTNIEIFIPELSIVDISIHNIRGQLIETLINESLRSGKHNIVWNGNSYPSGIYFLMVKSSGFSKVEKLILVK
ncbi:MAG TPA: T9SS type A sorting domain-containing protein [Candidatus Marinimicrobia bacterium]|jgi:hypothetical protein|nr:T9SS type A sorting domain-containing protein [Candidatus Neomarinimicrobiota bacterium]|tara:strand:- start:6258 stop:8651 length:2394 start_codon:yes stop_codon:yes gene_type:complete